MLKGLLSKNWALLKSDHFGIEMRNAEGVLGANNELKSDHFGIEINKLVYNLFLHLIVKIRPFWD